MPPGPTIKQRSSPPPPRPAQPYVLASGAEEAEAGRGEGAAALGASRGGSGHRSLGRLPLAVRQPPPQAVLVEGVVARRHVPPLPLLASLQADGACLRGHTR